jgi:lactate dehydrogenase-like 2-hydroxyacid dehydrogenase
LKQAFYSHERFSYLYKYRERHLVEEDILLSVLETDQVSHVYLDVFENKPLPKGRASVLENGKCDSHTTPLKHY